jgi:phosphatidylserine/phosphatidylglycerophosphate/cardiolipin synthase-like enzyme
MAETSSLLLTPGRNCWQVAKARRATVIIDADDYFKVARAAMAAARRRIMLIGWDFDARITLGDAASDGGPETVGDFILWLADRTPELEIFLLRWDIGAIKSFARGNTVIKVAQWVRHPRVHVRIDGAHPTASSHHQKIVTIDDDFAFCGGIDMTEGRWDTRAHLDDDPGRIGPGGEQNGPWHDATCAIEGPAASALSALCRLRWQRAGGEPIDPVGGEASVWPAALPVDFTDVSVAIARSEPAMPEWPAVYEIETLFLDQIARARRVIYAESQYFASRRVAEAIARRLDEGDGPEIIIINPLTADGWLEPVAMDSARARLFEALRRRDHQNRLRIYHPHTKAGVPIYCHAKILVIDDVVLRVGSSNLNNRSMRLDTECDIAIDAAAPGNADIGPRITAIRNGLIAEHLRCEIDELVELEARTGSLISAIEILALRSGGLQRYETPDITAVEAWLADNEVLDPEGPDEMFEATTERGLFRRFSALRHPDAAS